MWNSVTASRVSRCGSLESLFQRHGVGAGRIFFAAESAEPAGRDTDIGGIDVAVDVEVSLVAVHALANVIRQPTHGQNVASAVERKGIIRIKALTRHHFGMDGGEARVIGLKRVE